MNMIIKAGLLAGIIGLSFSSVAQAVEGEIVISESDYGNWISIQEAGGTQTYGLGAPEGFGENSLRFKTTDSSASKVTYIYPEFMLLPELAQFSYWTKQVVSSNPGGSAAMFVGVDLDGDYVRDTNLIYEPYLQNGGSQDAAPVVSGEWQNWSVVDGGLFWSADNYGEGASALASGVEGGLFTLDTIKANYPNAQVATLGISVGYENLNYNIGIDGVYINGQAYNFEGSSAEEDPVITPEEPPVDMLPTHKDQCKKGGWQEFATTDGQKIFRNQGQCVSFVQSNA